MCSRKFLIGLLVVSVALSSPLFAWFSPKEKDTQLDIQATAVQSEEVQSESEISESEEQNQLLESSSVAMTSYSDSLKELERTLQKNRVKEKDYLLALESVKEMSEIADAEYEELKADYDTLKADFEEVSKKADKYSFAGGFVQVNALMRNVLSPEWGVETVFGARFGNITTQVGAGYYITDKPWNENLEIKAGIGWEF